MRCEECGARPSGTARGWRAYLLPPEERRRVVFYCLRCAVRELGGTRRSARHS